MARPINGTLLVSEFINIGPGEYSFENATFVNYTDETGNAAYDITIGQVLYVQATNINTAEAITGVYHRYKLTDITQTDSFTVSGTILWDEPGEEIDSPTNSSYALLAETTTVNKLGLFPVDSLYPELPPGASLAALLLDVRFIIDSLSSGNFDNLNDDVVTLTTNFLKLAKKVAAIESNLETTFYTHNQTVDEINWIVEHNKGSIYFVCSVFNTLGEVIIPNKVSVVDENTAMVSFVKPSVGSVTLCIHNQVDICEKTTFYTHTQTTEDSNWVIEHNKDSSSFVCSVFNNLGELIIPDKVSTLDANIVVVTLSYPATGTATLFIHQ